MPERYTLRHVDQAVERFAIGEVRLYGAEGPWIWVQFPAADTAVDVRHELEAVPDGWVTLWTDTVVIATPGLAWTRDLAFLQSPIADRRCLVKFVTQRDPAVIGQP